MRGSGILRRAADLLAASSGTRHRSRSRARAACVQTARVPSPIVEEWSGVAETARATFGLMLEQIPPMC